MAREIIQARFWNNETKEFTYSGGTPLMLENFFRHIAIPFVQGKGELSYQTGLNDKNGKEIYEGDIIYQNGNYTADRDVRPLDNYRVVQWEDWSWNFDGEIEGPDDWEVIGNVFENKELIK